MSFSGSSTLPARRKRTVSERVIENGDPLVIKKKAREAAEQASSLAPSTTKKTTQVCFFSFKKIISPSFWPLLTMYCIQNSQLQPSIEDVVDDEDSTRLLKVVPKKASRVLELADGSEDNDVPIIIDASEDEQSTDTENSSSNSAGETPAESAEAELGKPNRSPNLLKFLS